jgi:hypothetical protein
MGIWITGFWRYFGTALTLIFVVIADALTLLNLPSKTGIPKFAAAAEIFYSVIILLYLSTLIIIN